jgi:hypothetical protein
LKDHLSAEAPFPTQLLLPGSQNGSYVVLLHTARGRRAALAVASAVSLAGCAIPETTTRLAPEPDGVTVTLRPDLPRAGQPAEVVVQSPGADSLVLESEDGLDRISGHGPKLVAQIGADFGAGESHGSEYAVRRGKRLLDRLDRPVTVSSCREGVCRRYYHDLPVRLPEKNARTVELTAGYSTIFARRSILGGGSTVLLREALSSGIWSLNGEWAGRSWNLHAAGFWSQDEHGGSLDLARVLKHGDEVSYGFAVHAGALRSGWLPEQESPLLVDRTALRFAVGPSVILQGITASSQLGIMTDGSETMQIVRTRVSANGNLMSERLPVTITAEKTFAFGGGAIVSRRRDALEQLTAGIYVVNGFAVDLGVTSHRLAWPNAHPADDLRGSEVTFTLGGQYTLSW